MKKRISRTLLKYSVPTLYIILAIYFYPKNPDIISCPPNTIEEIIDSRNKPTTLLGLNEMTVMWLTMAIIHLIKPLAQDINNIIKNINNPDEE